MTVKAPVDMLQKREENKEKILEHLNSHEFDCSVVLTVNSETAQLTQNWNFTRHPEDWTKEYLTQCAKKMCEESAKTWEKQLENPATIPCQIKFKKIVLIGPQFYERINLFCIGILPPKRLWFHFEFCMHEFGLCTRFAQANRADNGKPYWIVSLLLGPFIFWLSRDF